MSQTTKTQFPAGICIFVNHLENEGVKNSIIMTILTGEVFDPDTMQGTYTSLISRDHMTQDLLVRHLVAIGNRIRRSRNRQLAEYKGKFIPSTFCGTVMCSVTVFTLQLPQSTLKTTTRRAQRLPFPA